MPASIVPFENSKNENSIAEIQGQYVVEKILKRRNSRRGLEYFVKWLGFSNEENSWNLEQDLNCKEFIAEFDKAYVDSDDQLDDIEEVDNEETNVEKQKVLNLSIPSACSKSLGRIPKKLLTISKNDVLLKNKNFGPPFVEREGQLINIGQTGNNKIKVFKPPVSNVLSKIPNKLSCGFKEGVSLKCKKRKKLVRAYIESEDQLGDIDKEPYKDVKAYKPKVLESSVSNVSSRFKSRVEKKDYSNSKDNSTLKSKKGKKMKKQIFYEVENILRSRIKDEAIEYEVKWLDYEETTWEPEESLVDCPEMISHFRSRMEEQKLNETSSGNGNSLTVTAFDQRVPQSRVENFLNAVRDKIKEMNAEQFASAEKKILEIF